MCGLVRFSQGSRSTTSPTTCNYSHGIMIKFRKRRRICLETARVDVLSDIKGGRKSAFNCFELFLAEWNSPCRGSLTRTHGGSCLFEEGAGIQPQSQSEPVEFFLLHAYSDWLDHTKELISIDVADLSNVAVQISLDLDPLVWGIFCSFPAVPWGSATGKCRSQHLGGTRSVFLGPRETSFGIWTLGILHLPAILVTEMKKLGKAWLPAKHRDRTMVAIPVGPTPKDVIAPRPIRECEDLTCPISSSVSLG